jgi:type II secretory ATPase GspE/PulE/Tfp pilus assembly ATPase PilB-like protein
LKVPTYAIAAGLRGVITQQLVPRLDPGYTEEVPMDDPFVQRLMDLQVIDKEWTEPLLRGRDEPDGPPSGEAGRVAICEMLSVNPKLSAAIESSATRAEMQACLDTSCFGAFRDYGSFLLRKGIVAPERILEAMPRGAARLRFDEPSEAGQVEGGPDADRSDTPDFEIVPQE